LLRADLHIHTLFSPDSTTRLEKIVSRCLEIGINCIAVTDHNTIAGAIHMQEKAPFTVIVGEEVQTLDGEVIGLFLTNEIPSRLPAEETVVRIKAQGGLVLIPHPFDRFRRPTLNRQTLEALLPHVDIIEVFNSRAAILSDSDRAQAFAQNHGLLSSAGSDAHTIGEIGNAYVEMPEFSGREEFLSALAQGRIFGRRSSPWVHLLSSWARLRKLF